MLISHFKKYLNPNRLEETDSFKDYIFPDYLITNFIIFLTISLILYDYNKYISLFVFVQGITSAIGDSYILKIFNINYLKVVLIDRYLATITSLLFLYIAFSTRKNTILGIVVYIIGLYSINKSRNTKNIYDYELYRHLWHLCPFIYFIFFR